MPARPFSASSERRFVAWLATPSGIGGIFLVGLALRLILARGGGFPFDMSSFAAWSARLAARGPWHFYPAGHEQFFVDYPPGYLYVLWILGVVAKAFGVGVPPVFWLKLPPIFADLGLAWLVGIAAERLAPEHVARRLPMRAIGAAAILFNPAIFFISAVWGQADSVLAVLVVGALLLVGTGVPSWRREASGIALLGVAIGTKPQAVFVVPMFVLLLIWRHVRGRVDAADDPHSRQRGLWLGMLHVASTGVVAAAAVMVLFAPFALYPIRAYHFYVHASRTYQVTSVFAFNLWGAVGFWKPDSGLDAIRFIGVPAVVWGIALFVGVGALVLGRAWASLRSGQDEGRVLAFGSVAMSLVSFAIVTRVHERYLFLPLALAATLVGNRWLRRAFAAVSVMYLVNVYYPYVYYLKYVHRKAPTLGGFYDAFYGGGNTTGTQLRALSAFVGVACLVLAWRGWKALDANVVERSLTEDIAELQTGPFFEEPTDVVTRPRWSLHLHPVTRRNALIALAIFAIAFLSRVAGLGHPPGMYFDEVYHARTGAEYLGHKEVFEYTHPPLAKELIGFNIQHLSNFNARGGGLLPSGVSARTLGPRPNGMVWAHATGDTSSIQLGRIDQSCAAESLSTLADVDVRADAVATSRTATFIAGTRGGQSVLLRLEGADEKWRANLPGTASQIAVVGELAYVVTTKGELVSVSPSGVPNTVAVGAEQISASDPDGKVWASFPSQHKISEWDLDGRGGDTIKVSGEPHAIAAHRGSERVFVTVDDEVISYDTESDSEQARISGGASLLGTVPETTLIWAVEGRSVRAIEPHSGVVIGRLMFDRAPQRLTADPVHHRLVGVADRALECAGGRPQFAWRIGSAVTGALMVAFVFLLALRLTGSFGASILAALFLAVDGLAFSLSRIAMNDSYMTAFILAAWFCALSALYRWRGGRSDSPFTDSTNDRLATTAWIFATGVFAGLALSSKWPGLYAIGGIGLLFLWDGFAQGERSIWRVAGGFWPSAAVILIGIGVVPISIYILSYMPFFSLGHSFSDFLQLQKNMYEYHANLKATHPFGSPWYFWPIGRRAVFLYLYSPVPGHSSQMWTIPNLVVFWGGLFAMGTLAQRARRLRAASLAIVALGAAVQYVPWMLVTRVTFMYHYLPVVPFLAIALGWWLVLGLRGSPYHKALLIATPAVAVAFFLVVYPMLVGWSMPASYVDAVHNSMRWVFK